jgi:flagellar biosynthesis/type III secretory pathway protein FliH
MNLFQESSFYQMLLEEGFLKGYREVINEGYKTGYQQGIQKGIQKGLISLRETLLSIGETLLDPPDAVIRALIESIEDLDRLK